MASVSLAQALGAWQELETVYPKVSSEVRAFAAEAALVGGQLIADVPTRIEYMKLIRAEADEMLARAPRRQPRPSPSS